MDGIGIITLYYNCTQDVITYHEIRGTTWKITRARFERQLLSELQKDQSIPIDYKLAWTEAVLKGTAFKVLWMDIQRRLNLPDSALVPYKVNTDLVEIEKSSGSSPATSPTFINRHATKSHVADEHHTSSPYPSPFSRDGTVDHSSDDEDNSDIPSEHQQFMRDLVAQQATSSLTPPKHLHHADPPEILGDLNGLARNVNGLARKTGNDGEHGTKKNVSGRAGDAGVAAKSLNQFTPKASPKPRTPAKARTSATAKGKRAASVVFNEEVEVHVYGLEHNSKKAKMDKADSNGVGGVGTEDHLYYPKRRRYDGFDA